MNLAYLMMKSETLFLVVCISSDCSTSRIAVRPLPSLQRESILSLMYVLTQNHVLLELPAMTCLNCYTDARNKNDLYIHAHVFMGVKWIKKIVNFTNFQKNVNCMHLGTNDTVINHTILSINRKYCTCT